MSVAKEGGARVLHVLEATLGGTRRYLADVVNATRGLEISQGLAYATQRADEGFSAVLASAEDAGWRTFAVAMVREVRPSADAAALLALRRIIAQFRPNIIHCHSSKAGALGRLAAIGQATRSRVLYSPHALASSLGRVYALAERMLAPLTNAFVAVSQSERDEIVAACLAPLQRVSIVSPSIDVEAFAPRERSVARRELGLDAEPIIVGVGRLCVQKNPAAFVAMLGAVRALCPHARGVWVGDGELRPDIETLARASRLDDAFTIAGWQTDVRPYLAASDVVCSTSQYESFGYATAEALAMERPVVASAVTGTIDIIARGAEELLFKPGDIQGAAARVACLLADPERARALARNARDDVAERFSPARMRLALQAIYCD